MTRPAPGEGGGELVRVSVNALDHPRLVLELVDGVLEPFVQHELISHYHRVEHFTVVVIVQGFRSRCASQAMELTLPLPAECCTR